MKKAITFLTKYRRVLILTGAILIILALLFEPITTIFNVTANTERISFQTTNANASRLILEDAELAGFYDVLDSSFYGSLQLANNVNITAERIALGSVIIQLEAENSVGKLYREDNSIYMEAPKFLEIVVRNIERRVNQGETILFPIEGDINLGRSVDIEIYGDKNALLRSGVLSLTGKTRLFDEEFDAGNTDLLVGDQLIFDGIKDRAIGFITINENPGMQVAYRLMARKAVILKPGIKDSESGINIKARPLDRLLHAPSFQWLSLVFGSVIFLITISSFIIDLSLFRKENKL